MTSAATEKTEVVGEAALAFLVGELAVLTQLVGVSGLRRGLAVGLLSRVVGLGAGVVGLATVGLLLLAVGVVGVV